LDAGVWLPAFSSRDRRSRLHQQRPDFDLNKLARFFGILRLDGIVLCEAGHIRERATGALLQQVDPTWTF
jgi:hypothetical protein